MEALYPLHTREYYALKYHNHDYDTPTYMEALLGKHSDEYYKAVSDNISIIIISYTLKVVPRKSFSDHVRFSW